MTPAHPVAPGTAVTPGSRTVTAAATQAPAMLAHTGSEGLGLALPAAAGLVLGGAVLYRRGRAAQ